MWVNSFRGWRGVVSSEDGGRMELFYASVRKDEYVAPPVENSIPLPMPAPATCCLGPTTTLSPMEEISEEPAFICEDLDGLLSVRATALDRYDA